MNESFIKLLMDANTVEELYQVIHNDQFLNEM